MSLVYTLLALLAFVLLTAGTAVFVAAEFSLTALERSTVDANARTGGRRDKLVQRAHRTLSFQLSGAQVGISITTLITGYLAEPLVARLLEPAFTAMSLPRDVSERPGVGAGAADRHLGVDGVRRTGRPIPRGGQAAAGRACGGRSPGAVLDAGHAVDPPDQRHRQLDPAPAGHRARRGVAVGPFAAGAGSLVRNSARRGSLDPVTATLVDRSLQFGSRTAEELMTPRTEIVTLEVDDTVADLVDAAIETGYSRFPIVEGDLDETIGIVHVKQVFEVPPEQHKKTRLADLAQPVARVPSTLDGDDVMAQLRANGLQTALVVDEYGGTAGMVTVEDVIEEIVGDVRDEHDEPTADVVQAGRGWQVSGLLRIDEVAERDRIPGPRRRIRDHRWPGAAGARPHPRRGRVGRADGVRSGRTAGGPGALAGHGVADGRSPDRSAGTDEAGPARRRRRRR